MLDRMDLEEIKAEGVEEALEEIKERLDRGDLEETKVLEVEKALEEM